MKGNFRSLNEIITFRGGGTPRKDVPEYWSDEIPWASVKDFKSLDLSRTQDSISRKGLEASASNLIPAGHVIIPTRMALGKAAINSIGMAINQDLRALIPKVPLDSRYLLHSMIGLADEIVRYGSGATVKGITQENLGKLQIPLPPLAEQKRIAAILDAADALRAKRREALAQLDALLQSSFLTLFGDPVTNPMGWETSPLSGVAHSIVDGPFGSNLKTSDYVAAGVPVLQGKNITGDSFKWFDIRYITPTKARTLARSDARVGDHLLIKIGSIGYSAIIYDLNGHDFAIIPANMCRIRRDPKKVEALFLHAFLTNERTANTLRGLASKTAQPALSLGKIRALTIPLPPLSLQKKFAAIVESIERQKSTQRAHLAELDALFAALQHRAFRGEL